MPTYTITQFKTRASQILDDLYDGEEVIITRWGKPCAKLTSIPLPVEKKRSLAELRGILATSETPDWDHDELQSRIREIRDMWKSSLYSVEEDDAG